MNLSERSKFESQCEDVLQCSKKALENLENAVRLHFQNESKPYSSSTVQHYQQVFTLLRAYFKQVVDKWVSLQTRRSINQDVQRKARTLIDTNASISFSQPPRPSVPDEIE